MTNGSFFPQKDRSPTREQTEVAAAPCTLWGPSCVFPPIPALLGSLCFTSRVPCLLSLNCLLPVAPRPTVSYCPSPLRAALGTDPNASLTKERTRQRVFLCQGLLTCSDLIHVPRDSLWTLFKPLGHITVLLHDAGARLFIFFHCPVFLF